ncbi:hypothetical protein N431DRAFT_502641 [Stipitochalara longipes BDJ]|nr:hypothetical protein N431DRAFT_502641 [Stipitochalara longipes BDJ]
MHFSIIVCMFFAGTVFSATTSTRTTVKPPAATTAKVAVPRVLKPASPPTATDVKNSIINWDTSVNTVNDYLNNPENKTKLAAAIVFAKDEPVQLVTLMKVAALPKPGINAGTVLMGNFPSIISNLQSIQNGAMTTQDATAAVNFNRCCTVLPAIGALWTAAANQTKAGAVSMPTLEAQCSQMSCASGVSGSGSAANATTMGAVPI